MKGGAVCEWSEKKHPWFDWNCPETGPGNIAYEMRNKEGERITICNYCKNTRTEFLINMKNYYKAQYLKFLRDIGETPSF